jgi:hypothetical protein
MRCLQGLLSAIENQNLQCKTRVHFGFSLDVGFGSLDGSGAGGGGGGGGVIVTLVSSAFVSVENVVCSRVSTEVLTSLPVSRKVPRNERLLTKTNIIFPYSPFDASKSIHI